jgi:LysM repeat protein
MRRSLARVLALLALAAAALAVVLVVQSSRDDGKSAKATATTKHSTANKTHKAKPRKKATVKKRARVYRVKAGDTLSKIALRTGVSVAVLSELNPNLDPQALSLGQKIKLKP